MAKPLNIRRPMNKRSKHVKELQTGVAYNRETNSMAPLTDRQKSYRAGYNKGVTDYHNSVKASLGVKYNETLPAGKGINVGLFDIKK